ncbi:permease prefix domain 1-containing protein [Tissierella praeacuta]|uniref:permease prefix domain 1-containing protein n=1 Tax=Tissierella praeacuta TaxID=43131 RepID=UPI003342741D
MPFCKSNEFLKIVLSYIKFSFDREDIKLELESHILDKIEYYMEQGYHKEEAEELALKDMGNPKEIGIQLNKEHNPIIGWIWRITNIAVSIFVIINIFIVGAILLTSIFSRNPIKDIPKEDIVYRIDINEKVQLDDTVIKFTNVIYDKEGELHILYRYYDKRLWGGGWSLGTIGIIKDDLGNEYFSGSGSGGGGIISKRRRSLRDFPEEAKALIIEYDEYNRKYKIEIPLKVGEYNE